MIQKKISVVKLYEWKAERDRYFYFNRVTNTFSYGVTKAAINRGPEYDKDTIKVQLTVYYQSQKEIHSIKLKAKTTVYTINVH